MSIPNVIYVVVDSWIQDDHKIREALQSGHGAVNKLAAQKMAADLREENKRSYTVHICHVVDQGKMI